MEQNGTWLCPTEADRARLVDSSDRVRRARNLASAACGLGLVAAAPWIGWWIFGILAASAIQLRTLDGRIKRSPRPEYHVAASLFYTEALIALAIALTGGPHSPVLPLLALPMGMTSARFRPQVVIAGVGIAALMLLTVTVGIDASFVAHNPSNAIAILCLLVGVAAITSALQGAELQHRSESVLDPLTGLLNRKTLDQRFEEIAEQAKLAGGSVCVVVFDLDHFKAVNDEHGHERGDAVLRDAAYEIRKSLRSFELLYRLGGEEFLLVMPGAGASDGAELAEGMRAALWGAMPGGVVMTASFGVAAAAGADVSFVSMFRDADRALYEAKQAGRNCVRSSGTPSPVAVAG